jgi:hypothetical protein
MLPSQYVYNQTVTKDRFPLLKNPDTQFYTSRNLPILMGVNHITAGATDLVGEDTSAEATQKYGMVTTRPASWHGILDSDSILDSLPDSHTAFHAGVSGHSFNSPSIGLEVGLGTTNWNGIPADHREAILQNMAIWWAPRVIKHGIPLRYVIDRDKIDYLIARRDKIGFTDHYILNPANRSDPGLYRGTNTFPRARFLDLTGLEVARLLGGGAPARPPVAPSVPAVTVPLKADGRLGPATITRWQWVMGTKQDGSISYPFSSLVNEVQEVLRAAKIKGKNGQLIVVDGRGILPNLSRDYGPTNTVWGLQTALGMDSPGEGRDGVLSNPKSKAVAILQVNLNKAKKGSRKFF